MSKCQILTEPALELDMVFITDPAFFLTKIHLVFSDVTVVEEQAFSYSYIH